jgi:hypothetical protein
MPDECLPTHFTANSRKRMYMKPSAVTPQRKPTQKTRRTEGGIKRKAAAGRHGGTRTLGHSDTQTHRHSDTQTRRHRDTETQRHRGTETRHRHRHRHTDMDTDTDTDTARTRTRTTQRHRDTDTYLPLVSETLPSEREPELSTALSTTCVARWSQCGAHTRQGTASAARRMR